MKKIFVLALMVLIFDFTYSQSPDFVRSLTFKKLFIDYKSQNGGTLTAFKDYRHGFEIGLSHNITKNLSLYIPGKFGVVQDSIDKTFKTLLGADAVLQYHFFNKAGNITPYILAGGGITQVYKGDYDVNIPLGIGINFRAAERIFINIQSEYRISLNLEKNVLHHGVGIVYSFGGKKVEGGIVVQIKDGDGDGVRDDIDLCPQVRGPAELNGCPDTDGDEVPDYRDACPDTKGLKDLKGCPDSDGDGVADLDDECPNLAGSKFNKGCPEEKKFSDKDKDGVEDKDDKCPDQVGTAATKGCPDSDNDGVADHEDECPVIAGPVNAKGCPDSDADGTPDNKDKCPKAFGPKVYDGCPDTDGDGLDDYNDKCPTMPGTVENKGCPKISAQDKETLDIAMRSVEFDLGKATLKTISYQILNQVSEIMKKYPDYNVVISGHTDNTGSSTINQSLSEQRAKSCYDYMMGQGVSALRMSYVGYGESRPISTNDTPQGRALNRRVEFNLVPAK
ncbi:MAG: OmpA family protein [Deltaproteobacteria bacterium]